MTDPAPEYAAQTEMAHIELMETLKRLEGQGLDARAVAAALTGVLVTFVATLWGWKEVPGWLTRTAKQTIAHKG